MTVTVNVYKQPLQFRYRKEGTWETITTRYGHEIRTAPFIPLDTECHVFRELKKVFRQSGLKWKVYENGETWFLVPHYQKFGWLLHEVAQAYFIMQNAEQTSLNEYRDDY